MRDFRDAIAHVIADLTPQPWDFTDPTGATLTVIPEGLPSEKGYAEVQLRVTVDKHTAAEVSLMTVALPAVIAALEAAAGGEFFTVTDDALTLTPADAGGVTLTVLERMYAATSPDVTALVHLPATQRMPLVSALRRALDVARGWES